MTKLHYVTYRWNDIDHVVSFTSYVAAMIYYNKLKEENKEPSYHES